MPTPIGHALGGAIVALAVMPEAAGSALARLRVRRSAAAGARGFAALRGLGAAAEPRICFFFCVVAACLPDMDFFWGRHNMETHSLGFAALVGLAVLVWRRQRRLALACTLAVCTHVLFDWLGSDDFPPLGVMAFWPLTNEFYFANAFIFDAISRRYWLPGFVAHNVIAVLREIAILAPIAAALWWWRHATEARNHGEAYVRRNGQAN